MSTALTTAQTAQQGNRTSDGKYTFGTHSEPEALSLSRPAEVPTGNWTEADSPKDRAKRMLEDLSTAIEDIAASGKLSAWMDSMRANGLSRWSLNNRMIASMQVAQRLGVKSFEELAALGPNEMNLMGYKQWAAQGRNVTKGAKAIYILAPLVGKREDKKTGEEKTVVFGFRTIPVFNVTDTEGDPLPESPYTVPTGQVPDGFLTGMRDRIAAEGFTYREEEIPGTNPETGEGKLGYTRPSDKSVVVDSRLNPALKATTIAHELAHIKLGHIDDIEEYKTHRGQMETEAEMTSYLVCREMGMDIEQANSFAPAYIAGWSKDTPGAVQKAMGKSMEAYRSITSGEWPSEDSEDTSRNSK